MIGMIIWAVLVFIVGWITFFLFFIISTPLHELWHIITGKIFGADISVDFWFHWRNFFKYLKRRLLFLKLKEEEKEKLFLGQVFVTWGRPSQERKFDRFVDLMGGLGSGWTVISSGIFIFYILFSGSTNLFFGFSPLSAVATGLVVGIIANGVDEIRGGIKEWREGNK